jgi:hypothetical protein
VGRQSAAHGLFILSRGNFSHGFFILRIFYRGDRRDRRDAIEIKFKHQIKNKRTNFFESFLVVDI